MTRVGIVAKSHLRDATPHLTAIEAWLAARGHYTVFETATDRSVGEAEPLDLVIRDEVQAPLGDAHDVDVLRAHAAEPTWGV